MPVDLRQVARDVVAELVRDDGARRSRREDARRASIQREAGRFLRELDPDSQEGMWFDALAESYPSRLDAAIAYVEEVRRPSGEASLRAVSR